MKVKNLKLSLFCFIITNRSSCTAKFDSQSKLESSLIA
jgi:hypothetical protein